MEKAQQRSEDIRAALAAEIARKEKQLRNLRETLASLDSAMQAAATAHAASLAAAERSVAALAMTAAEQERSSAQVQAAAPASNSASKPRPSDAPSPKPVADKVAASPAAAPPPAKAAQAPAKEETPAQPATPEVAPVASTTPAPAPVYTSATNPWPAPAGKYVNMKVWKAIQNLLTEARQSMTLDEIVRELEKGGATLGDNPIRTVSTAIGYMNEKIFYVSKSGGRTVVSVLSPSADY